MYRLLLLVLALGFPLSLGAAQRPFPQHTTYTDDVISPSLPQADMDAAVTAFHKVWKAKYLRPGPKPGQLYVFANPEKTDESKTTRALSEAQGYGMLISVLMAGADPEARATFDALYRYAKANPSTASPHLMAWQQLYRDGAKTPAKEKGHRNSATDGDLDIALALLMASKQWGNDGEINYRAEGLKVAAAILEHNTQGPLLKLGSWVGEDGKYAGAVRTSDIMPAHFRTFQEASEEPRWRAIGDRGQVILSSLVRSHAPKSGLLPDFAITKDDKYRPAPAKFLEGEHDGAYFYNACRVPWRLGVDYLLSGDPRSLERLETLNAWVRKATGDDPGRINAGYALDGKPLKEDRSAAFSAPFAVAAMTDATPGNQAWLDALWRDLVTRPAEEDAYYGNTLKLLALIALSGNWWQ